MKQIPSPVIQRTGKVRNMVDTILGGKIHMMHLLIIYTQCHMKTTQELADTDGLQGREWVAERQGRKLLSMCAFLVYVLKW